MEKDLNPDIIKATQNSLGKYVKRPPLTEKLLRKPPFRFLHDIVTTVLKTTGFFEGLFEPDELVSDNVKERDSKVTFLNKIITVLGTTTGQVLTVKPSKIVAGQDPDKTNELLQCLAFALDNKLSSDEAVKKYKEGAEPQPQKNDLKSKDDKKEVKKSTEVSNKKLTFTSTDKLTGKKRDSNERSITRNEKERNNVNRVKQKENVTKKESPPKKITEQQTKPLIKKKSSLDIPSIKNEKLEKKIAPSAVEVIKQTKQDDELLSTNLTNDSNRKDNNLSEELQKDVPDTTDKLNASYTIAENDLNSSLSSQDLMEVDDKGNNDNNVTKNDIRSNHANRITEVAPSYEQDNRSAPQIRHAEVAPSYGQDNKTVPQEQHADVVPSYGQDNKTLPQERNDKKLQSASSFGSNSSETEHRDSNSSSWPRPPSVRPSSSRPGAPRLREKNENILTNNESLMVGKVNIIAESTTNEEEDDSSIVIVEHQSDPIQDQLKLSSNQHGHLVQQILDSQKELSQVSGKTEIEWQFGAQKAREAANQEVDQVKFNIQALSRVANPLGKLLDHIQEDVEVMRQELQQWTTTYRDASKELFKQKSANEDSLFPLHSKLKQINLEINEKHEKINDLKIVIHKNAARIDKLLANGNVQ